MKKLYGLVVCGGQSTRMRTDKSLLEYHNLPQWHYVYNLLSPICDKVFISHNAEQAMDIEAFYNPISDHHDYLNIGPMAALLSAFKQQADASFLVVGCDYPYINEMDLKRLIDYRNEGADAICYYNPENKFEEPLLAIYENACLSKLLRNFEDGNYSLRYFLKSIYAKKIMPESLESLISVDTMEQYQEALVKLKESSKNSTT